MRQSTHYFIRTKALKHHSYLLYPGGDAITPINPRAFRDPILQDRDILMAKDSKVGECAMVHDRHWENHMFSGGIVRFRPAPGVHHWYLFAFLKNPIFKAQLQAMVPRAATITHAKQLWLDCLIPFPKQEDADRVIRYVCALMQAIVEKEKTIRKYDTEINRLINEEFKTSQKPNSPFFYSYPTLEEIQKNGRLDAAIYAPEYKEKIHWILNYKYGTGTPTEMGFVVVPGPSLEIKILRTRIDSDVYKPGFYALIIPTNISEYGTMYKVPYLGTAKKLPLLQPGDIIFGESGNHRSVVLIDFKGRYTTNAHGLCARRKDGNVIKSIFFRCFFNWLYKNRVIDLLSVGGSGGHFSPAYFDKFIRIPKFPDDKQEEIARLYHNIAPPKDKPTLDTFVDWHRRCNDSLGIWELDREMKALQGTIGEVQEKIVKGETVEVPI